jgi:phenylalanyl-tRNA synthetase beta chain
MTISYNWLSEYIDQKVTPQQMSEILTSVGLEVEAMDKLESVKGGLEGLLIGKVVECGPHPDADKLRLTKVDIGAENLLQIVCGAPNVAQGQTVVVASIGTTIYPTEGAPLMMRKAKIRGVESEGMICAEDEIGLGNSHSGIIVINDEVKPGTPASVYYQFGEPDYIYEIGLTPNRMDSMSHIGVAKDVCAFLSNENGKMVLSKMPSIQLPESTPNDAIRIEISDEKLCARYAGVCIDNIKVGDSPEWLQNRLKSIGLRPINNVVDITNFVLHEIGQPLHAFDRSKIIGDQIVVKNAGAREKFLCLDEKERELNEGDIVIANESESMCIAGVFGGLHSGVSEQTTSLFLESAWFTPSSIRKTSMRLGLRTDAAIRFEKSVDISNVMFALQRAAALIVELAGGHISSEFLDIYPEPFEPTLIDLNFAKINALAGKQYETNQVKSILNSLCFKVISEDEKGMTVAVPFAKNDISMQADVVEEIMRIDGLDNIPFTGKISFSIPPQERPFKEDPKKKIANQLVGKGFSEIFTNSITNSTYYTEQDHLVKMINSLSANLDTMRPSMLETGLEPIAYNFNRKNSEIHFFEFGKVYSRFNEKFVESEMLALYISGHYDGVYWNQKQKPLDMYYLKGIIDEMFSGMKLQFMVAEQQIQILFQKKAIGHICKVSAEKMKQFGIKQEVYYAELNWGDFKKYAETQKIRYVEVPKFPAVERDLAMVIDQGIQYQDVQKNIRQLQSKLLQNINIFDVFESDKLGKGKKSYAISLSFSDAEKTLTDVEVETEMSKIIKSLEEKLGAIIRGN